MSISRKAAALVGLLVASLTLVTLSESASAATNPKPKTITVLSDRSDFHIKPILEAFTASTGIKVNAVFVDQGSLPARLASGADKADVLITTDLPTLTEAKAKGYTQPMSKSTRVAALLKNPATKTYVDVKKNYAAISYRARAIIYNPKKVDVNTLTGYDDLASPAFKGRVCIRPFTHIYNVTMLSEMIADRGETAARAWVAGVKSNLAVTPTGNDRNQAKLVSQGVCDIALMNTYYYGLLLSNKEQRPIANATELFFPEQAGKGSYALYSGIALTKKAKNISEATKLIDYILGKPGQNYIAQATFEYPTDSAVKLSVIAEGFAEGQPGVTAGKIKINQISASRVAKNNGVALQILSEASAG